MSITLRPGRPDDARSIARVCYAAFRSIASEHNFPPDLPSLEATEDMARFLLRHPAIWCLVAEQDAVIVGSNFLDERCPIAGIGPLTVDPHAQNAGVGRLLMERMLERVDDCQYPGVRLVQAAYHNRSLALYARLGFEVREPLATLQGPLLRHKLPGYTVRPADFPDLDACAQLCIRVHGHQRTAELEDALALGSAAVVVNEGRITGYTTGVQFSGHSVGETNSDLKALIAAAPGYYGPGFLVPTRNGDLFRWCLEHGLRVVQVMTLMTRGLYNEPRGAYLPSVIY